ncbi:DUF3667 domain-containing protein [Dyella sp. 2HG41-7]|uniref:DUF3667 domain-containing protein n=1 Tax=Dyella sp. 2HG41-7 TaxID=2883239 RepID=UPI001F3311A6|nr:DUF3667 domain-containing protein [Dyella sp. 2HG41-7]
MSNKELTSYEGACCANCQTPLEGEYCHHCGQSVHSVLRPVHGLFEEFFETFLHIDGRILHTLPPLFRKPGFLTLEYFSGRRVRYIAPFRLMFVLCLLSFFVLHLATDVITHRIEERHRSAALVVTNDDFAQAQTAPEVSAVLSKRLAALEATRSVGNAAIVAQIDKAEQQLRDQANDRLTELGAPAKASTVVAAAPPPHAEQPDKPINPVHISWLPAFANERLTEFLEHARRNLKAFDYTNHHGTVAERQEAIDHLVAGFYGVLPGTMLVLVPVFALLLTLFYIFKRRLYMEHLIVSLHSHAFIFLSLLLIVLVGILSTWLKPYSSFAGHAVSMLQLPLFLWIPAYLLIMQKRVYRQGWAMTVVKFWFIGWFYFWLLVLFLLVAAALGIVH